MITEHGLIRARFSPRDSVEDALAGVRADGGVAWVGGVDPSLDELQAIARSFGVDNQTLARLEQRRQSPRAPRSRVVLLDDGAHLILLGVQPDATGGPRVRGHLELLALRRCIAVLATDLPAEMGPTAIRASLEPLLGHADAPDGGMLLGLVVSHVLDCYEDLLEELEDDAAGISESLFVARPGGGGGGQLERIYALSGPVHAAAVGIQPLAHGFADLLDATDSDFDVSHAASLSSEVSHLRARLERIDAVLDSAQQTYFNLTQDEANRLMERQGDVTRRMSGYALLIAIPTIAFSLYGTNFEHIPLIGEDWGYYVMLAVTGLTCLITWWRLRVARWI